MKPSIRAYVGLVVAFALGIILVQDWSVVVYLPLDHTVGLFTLLVLGLIAESLTLPISIGKSSGSTSSIIFLPLIACVLLFGSAPTVLFMGLTGIIGEFLIRKKPTIRATFNSAQYILAAGLGSFAYEAFGGRPLALTGVVLEEEVVTELFAFLAFGFTFVVINNAAVSIAIALSEGESLKKVWSTVLGRSGTNLYYDILVSPIAIAVALLYLQLNAFGLFLAVLPLFFIRQAYLTIVQLRQANRDLLTALIKAIETRDPYTSGHSLRVSVLARRISDALGLSQKMQKAVEEAALLHDIGKIEPVYSQILRKPSDLTQKEREIIESHVLKGVELLEQLSSFSPEVVAGVRGHHERVDGMGYPDGLKGEAIPISARIIKVCDAIDAMLSDRPYRRNLDISAVKEQLSEYADREFDSRIVKAVFEESILEKHAAEIAIGSVKDGQVEEEISVQRFPRPKPVGFATEG
jgi:putative nucleotidyltransferase with HDIG domain